jgi:hypothetical protein
MERPALASAPEQRAPPAMPGWVSKSPAACVEFVLRLKTLSDLSEDFVTVYTLLFKTAILIFGSIQQVNTPI